MRLRPFAILGDDAYGIVKADGSINWECPCLGEQCSRDIVYQLVGSVLVYSTESLRNHDTPTLSHFVDGCDIDRSNHSPYLKGMDCTVLWNAGMLPESSRRVWQVCRR